MTDGGFRPDGTFVSWPAPNTARLTEAFRRAVLRHFVRLEPFDEDQAAGMLTWPHSGFHVHTAVWVSEDDRAFATRLARYCARNPVALERLTYDRAARAVTYRSDKSEGPTAGTETADPLVFVARPHASPDPRLPDRAGRRAQAPVNPETVWAGRLATTGGGAPGSLNLTPTPRRRARTFGTRVRPSGASTRSPPTSLPPRCPPFPRPSRRTNESATTPPRASRCSCGR